MILCESSLSVIRALRLGFKCQLLRGSGISHSANRFFVATFSAKMIKIVQIV